MNTYIKAGLLGGIILFVWSFISWMLLPWHTVTLNNFKDEKVVAESISANVSQSGMYLMPAHMDKQQANSDTTKRPFVFASVRTEGMPVSMNISMLLSLITQVIAAIFVAWLLSKTRGLNYYQRVVFVVIFALAAGVVTEIPYWNWFGFDPYYTLVSIADLLIGWFFAGLVLARYHRAT